MATIRKRGTAQWEARIRKRGLPITSKTFDTKIQAEQWSRQIESEMDRGVFISRAEAEATTLHVALERYIQDDIPRLSDPMREGNRAQAKLLQHPHHPFSRNRRVCFKPGTAAVPQVDDGQHLHSAAIAQAIAHEVHGPLPVRAYGRWLVHPQVALPLPLWPQTQRQRLFPVQVLNALVVHHQPFTTQQQVEPRTPEPPASLGQLSQTLAKLLIAGWRRRASSVIFGPAPLWAPGCPAPGLSLKLPQPPGLGHLKASELAAPLVEGRVRDADLAAQLRHRTPGLRLLEKPDDLLFREPGLPHVRGLLRRSHKRIAGILNGGKVSAAWAMKQMLHGDLPEPSLLGMLWAGLSPVASETIPKKHERPPVTRVCIIDDDEFFGCLLASMLSGPEVETAVVQDMAQAKKLLSEMDFDVVLLDVRLPDGNGLDLAPSIKELPSAPELIIMTGVGTHSAKRIAEFHGDSITRGCSVPGQTSVTMLLPRTQSAKAGQ